MVLLNKILILLIILFFLSKEGFAEDISTPNVDKFFPAPIAKSSQFGPYWLESQFHVKDETYYKKNYYNLETLQNHVLTKDFGVQQQSVNLYQARLDIISKVGRILPRLDLQLNLTQQIPINLSALIAGLFEFIFPENWFNFMRSKQLYKSQRYTMADILLDRHLLTQVTYFQIHRLKWYYSIHILFYQYLLDFIRYFKENYNTENQEAAVKYLLAYANDMYLTALNLRQEINQALPDYAFLVNIEGVTKESHFDIVRIPFPSTLEDYKKIEPRNYIDKARDNSLVLKIIDHLKKAAILKTGATATSFTKADEIGIQVDFGLDTLVNPFIDAAEIKKMDIKQKEAYAKIERNMVLATNLYNLSLDRFRYATMSLDTAKESCELMIQNLERSGTLALDIHHAIEFLHNNYIALADAYHDFWIASASIKRLLVTPLLQDIEKHLPNDKEVKYALDYVKDAKFHKEKKTKPKGLK